MDRASEHGVHGHGRARGRGPRMLAMEFGGTGWGGGRRRMRRGDIRTVILVALADGPANGYEVMRRLEERSGGMWRPSPGSVYPTLQMLEEEGLVRSTAHEGSRTYELTESGTAAAEAGRTRSGRAPWEQGGENDERLMNLRQAVGQVHIAAKQVAQAGSADQIDRSIEIFQKARKELYQILAED